MLNLRTKSGEGIAGDVLAEELFEPWGKAYKKLHLYYVYSNYEMKLLSEKTH